MKALRMLLAAVAVCSCAVCCRGGEEGKDKQAVKQGQPPARTESQQGEGGPKAKEAAPADPADALQEKLAQEPGDLAAYTELAAIYEERGKHDLALGCYDLLLAAAGHATEKPKGAAADAVLKAKREVRALAGLETEVAGMLRDFPRAAMKLSVQMLEAANGTGAAKGFGALCRLSPGDAKAVENYYWAASLPDSNHQPPAAPAGYKSLFNYVDLSGWNLTGGTWFSSNAVIRGSWGTIESDEKLDGYRLKLTYRAGTTDRGKEKPFTPELRLPGCAADAWLQLAGVDAGMVKGLEPTKKYVNSLGAQGYELKIPATLTEKDWVEMEVRVNGSVVRVDLNGATVFESEKSSRLEGELSKNRKAKKPDVLSLAARPWIEIKGLWFKK